MSAITTTSSFWDRRTWARGILGLGKALLRREPVSDAVRQERRATCAKCPEARHLKRVGSLHVLTATSVCGMCHCNLRGKTRLSGETCPTGKW